MKRDRNFPLSLTISVIVHGAVIALAASYALRHSAPVLSLAGGAGGDGIKPGEMSFVAPGLDVIATDPLPQPLMMDIVTAEPEVEIPEIEVPPAPSEAAAELPDITTKLIGIGVNQSNAPAFAPRPAPTQSPAGEIGQGGLGGDGLLRGAPSPSARNKPPRYPVEARRRGIEGTVILDIDVLDSGKVGGVKVGESSGHALLDNAAIDAVRKWTFEPSVAGTKLLASSVRLPVRFVLH